MLGKHQSQTPFSSVLWFLDQNLISKICNLICSKKLCAKKRDPKIFSPKIYLRFILIQPLKQIIYYILGPLWKKHIIFSKPFQAIYQFTSYLLALNQTLSVKCLKKHVFSDI